MALFGHRSRTDECQPSGEAGALSVAERYRTLRASIRASSWSAAVSRILTVSDGASNSIWRARSRIIVNAARKQSPAASNRSQSEICMALPGVVILPSAYERHCNISDMIRAGSKDAVR